MKKIIISSFFLLYLITLNKAIAQESTTDINKVNTTPVIKKSTPMKLYYPNGSIKEIREIVDQKLHGSWSYFHHNGQLKKEGSFINNNPHGIWKTYDLEGNMILIENYTMGVENGIWKSFYANGQLKTEGAFVNGKRQGRWNLHSYSGALEKTISFIDDQEQNNLITPHKSKNTNLFSANQSVNNY